MAIDASALTYKAKSDDTLLPPPENPKYRVALVASYVDSHPTGGSDKLTNGHRFDTVAIANGLINSGIACQIIFYNVPEHDKFFEIVAKFDGVIIRINPGQITANGGNQQKFDDDMMKVTKKIPVWPTPETMSKMGAKDALCQIKGMDFGLQDTLGYYSPEDIKAGFAKTIAFQPRVVKQNRGSAGEGIWIIKLKSGNYCDQYCDRVAADDEMLILKEANDNHVEEHSIAEFVEFCVNGRTDKSGTWTSAGTGKYFEGGAEAGGQMVDQRFLPRIDEGEARFVMIGPELNRVEHYVYIGGVGGETKTTIHKPDDADFPYKEIQKKVQDEIPVYLTALGLPASALPLLWAADFIPVDDHKSPFVIGEFNCSCLGLAGFLNVRGKDISELKDEDRDLGMKMANLIGQKALEALEKANGYCIYYHTGFTGRALEQIWMLEHTGAPYSMAEVKELPEGFPCFAPPMMKFPDGNIMAQTVAINKTLGKKLGLYPDSAADEAHALQLALDTVDIFTEMAKIPTRAEVLSYFAESGRGDKWLGQLEKALTLAGGEFAVGSKLTYPDFAVYNLMTYVTSFAVNGAHEYVPSIGDLLGRFPKLTAHWAMMSALPKVKAFNDKNIPFLPASMVKK